MVPLPPPLLQHRSSESSTSPMNVDGHGAGGEGGGGELRREEGEGGRTSAAGETGAFDVSTWRVDRRQRSLVVDQLGEKSLSFRLYSS